MHHAELVEPGRPREQVLALRHAPREVVEPNSPLVETTFTQVRVVVQIDQHPRSRTGEQHGVSAVLVTVVRAVTGSRVSPKTRQYQSAHSRPCIGTPIWLCD